MRSLNATTTLKQRAIAFFQQTFEQHQPLQDAIAQSTNSLPRNNERSHLWLN